MKSLAELAAIKEKARGQMNMSDNGEETIRVVVGMATCGIAAGARPVLTAFSEEVLRRNLKNVFVTQTGCIGVCRLEPVVEVTEKGKNKVTYVGVKPDMVPRIVAEHLVNRQVVSEYTIGAMEQ